MSDRINCRNCIHFNDLEHRCCLNDGSATQKECYFILSTRKPKGKDVVIEHLKTKITALEAKLAESEKDRLMWQEMHKSADRLNKEICETDIYPLQEENQQLKDKLEIKMEELHIAYCGIESVKTKNGNLKEEVKELKQQLAEKETRIAELEDKDWYEGTIKQLEEQNERLINQLAEKEKEIERLNYKLEEIDNNFIDGQQADQSKTDFAIEKLEKVKKYVISKLEFMRSSNVEMTCRDRNIILNIYEEIDQQIKELKEGK